MPVILDVVPLHIIFLSTKDSILKGTMWSVSLSMNSNNFERHSTIGRKKSTNKHNGKTKIMVFMKGKVKLPLCLIKHHTIRQERRYSSTILDLCTRWR
jgi:hypothetical protein